VLDLDPLNKIVNDTHGHAVGDRHTQTAAQAADTAMYEQKRRRRGPQHIRR
jgi:predicted signal transduction protein with EAL and GGDEF domain